MVEKKKKPVDLKFLVVSLITCYVASGIVWSILLATRTPWYYANARPQDHVNTLVLNILPLTLLPLAISVTIYGIFKTKLNPLEIFLSSWYISTFEALAFFSFGAASSHGCVPYPPPQFVFLSFLIAGILTIIYLVLKRQKVKALNKM